MKRETLLFATPTVRVIAAAWLIANCHTAIARPSCSFTSAAPVDFGNYEVFATQPNNSGVGSIQIQCQGGGGPFKVTLSTGQSHTYTSRQMRSGANTLQYNLYTSPARSIVWGDETGANSAINVPRNTQSKLDIFGQIPALQDAVVGTYSDNVTVIVNF